MDIALVQQWLGWAGHAVPITGELDTATVAALTAYQEHSGGTLQPRGQLDEPTVARLAKVEHARLAQLFRSLRGATAPDTDPAAVLVYTAIRMVGMVAAEDSPLWQTDVPEGTAWDQRFSPYVLGRSKITSGWRAQTSARALEVNARRMGRWVEVADATTLPMAGCLGVWGCTEDPAGRIGVVLGQQAGQVHAVEARAGVVRASMYDLTLVHGFVVW